MAKRHLRRSAHARIMKKTKCQFGVTENAKCKRLEKVHWKDCRQSSSNSSTNLKLRTNSINYCLFQFRANYLNLSNQTCVMRWHGVSCSLEMRDLRAHACTCFLFRLARTGESVNEWSRLTSMNEWMKINNVIALFKYILQRHSCTHVDGKEAVCVACGECVTTTDEKERDLDENERTVWSSQRVSESERMSRLETTWTTFYN